MEAIFIMNEDQKAILETVKRFVEEEVQPRSARLDADPDPAAGFSWEIVEKAHELGIRTMTLSEKWGGLGTDSLTTSMVIEELAHVAPERRVSPSGFGSGFRSFFAFCVRLGIALHLGSPAPYPWMSDSKRFWSGAARATDAVRARQDAP